MTNVFVGFLAMLAILGVIMCLFFNNKIPNIDFFSRHHTDVIKGIAIIMIVVAHIGNFSGVRYFTPLGGIGVALFLICSGFGLYKSYGKNGLDGFFKKRLSKILIPYWFAVVFYYMISPSEFSVFNFIKNVLLINVNSYWWFIQFILILYIVFYLVFRFVPDNMRMVTLWILSFIFFLSVRQYLWSEQAFSFAIGVSLAKYNKGLTFHKAWAIGGTAIIIGMLSLLAKQIPMIRESNYLIFNTNQVILCIGIAVAIIYLAYPTLRFIRIFSIAGLASYEIYLVHTLFIFIIVKGFTLTNIIEYIVVCTLVVLVFYYTSKVLSKSKGKLLLDSH